MPPQPTRCATLRPTTRRSRSLRESRPTRLTSIGAWHRVNGRMFSMTMTRSVYNDAPDAFAFVHQVESLVDVRQRHGVGDHRIDLDLAVHVPVDAFRHVGSAARSAERGAFPDAAGDQLEWTGCDLRAGRGDADDDGLSPAAMAGLQCLAHHRDVAGAVEGVIGTADLVGAALGHVDEVGDEITANLFGIDEVGHAEALAPLLLGIVDVDAHDHVGAGKPQSLDDIEADAAEPEHDAFGQTLSKGASSRILATAISGSTVKFEKVDVPM